MSSLSRFVTSGITRVDGESLIEGPDGVYVADVSQAAVVATGGYTARSLAARFEYCPEDFGAYADNSHDDTTAVQNWLNYIAANNGKGKLNPSTYLITGQITIPNAPLSVRGSWGLSTINCQDVGGLSFVATGAATNLELSDFIFEVSGSVPGLSYSAGYQNVAGANVRLNGVQFNGAGTTAANLCVLNGIQQSEMENCQFRNGGESNASLLIESVLNLGINQTQFLGKLAANSTALSVQAGSGNYGTQGIRLSNSLIVAYQSGIYAGGGIDWITCSNNMIDQCGLPISLQGGAPSISGQINISKTYLGQNSAFTTGNLAGMLLSQIQNLRIDCVEFAMTSGNPAIWFNGACSNVRISRCNGISYSGIANFPAATDIIFDGNDGLFIPPQPITVGTSPFTFTAPTRGTVMLEGGSLSSLAIGRAGTNISTGATNLIPVEIGDQVIVGYTSAPTMKMLWQC
jgi:hypothetical protein